MTEPTSEERELTEAEQEGRESFLEEQKVLDMIMLRPHDHEVEHAQLRRSAPYSLGPNPRRLRYNWLEVAQRGVPEAVLATPPGNLFFTYRRKDGEEFLAPAANWETYVAKGYEVTDQQYIEDFVGHLAEQHRRNTEAAEYDPEAASKVDTGYPPGSSPDTVERLTALQEATTTPPDAEQNPPA
jgi:hypothetical protein